MIVYYHIYRNYFAPGQSFWDIEFNNSPTGFGPYSITINYTEIELPELDGLPITCLRDESIFSEWKYELIWAAVDPNRDKYPKGSSFKRPRWKHM